MFKNILKKCVILLIISFSILYGEGVKKVGSVGYKFLSIPIGARSTAMGNSLLTYADGASAVFWNPALLTQVDKYSVFISHNNHFVDLKMDAVAAAMRVGNIGVFALRFFSFSSGESNVSLVDKFRPMPLNLFPNRLKALPARLNASTVLVPNLPTFFVILRIGAVTPSIALNLLKTENDKAIIFYRFLPSA